MTGTAKASLLGETTALIGAGGLVVDGALLATGALTTGLAGGAEGLAVGLAAGAVFVGVLAALFNGVFTGAFAGVFVGVLAGATDFFAVGAAAFEVAAGLAFLAGGVTVFFEAGALTLVGVFEGVLEVALEVALGGVADFFAATVGALVTLPLADETFLLATAGLAFLVLVAFNSCLLNATRGARRQAFENRSGRLSCTLDRRASVQASLARSSYTASAFKKALMQGTVPCLATECLWVSRCQ